MGVLDRKTYKKIEYYLYHYFEMRREVEQEKEDIIEAGGRDIVEWGRGISYHSESLGKSIYVKNCI